MAIIGKRINRGQPRKVDSTTVHFVGSGTSGPFILPSPRDDENIDVWVNGVWQPDSAYTVTRTNLTFVATIGVSVPIVVKFRPAPKKSVTPVAGSVTDTELAAGIDLSRLANGEPGSMIYFDGTGTPAVATPAEIAGQVEMANIMINSWRIAENSGQAVYNMSDGISDDFQDETGIDTVTSTLEIYNGTSDYYTNGASTDTLLQSVAFTAAAQPDLAYLVIRHNEVAAVTMNTDLIASVSRDNGVTWSVVTLVDHGTITTGASVGVHKVFYGLVDISGQPAGTSMKYKIETANLKEQRIHSVGLQWS